MSEVASALNWLFAIVGFVLLFPCLFYVVTSKFVRFTHNRHKVHAIYWGIFLVINAVVALLLNMFAGPDWDLGIPLSKELVGLVLVYIIQTVMIILVFQEPLKRAIFALIIHYCLLLAASIVIALIYMLFS